MEPDLPTIQDIADALEALAPPEARQSYDNVGLQVGDPSRPVSAAIIALDMIPSVLQEARAAGAELIVTHHPLLFKPLNALTPGSLTGSLAFRLAESGIALYSSHTNLDAAPSGVSFALAHLLGLHDVRLLRPLDDTLVKLVTFVPARHFDPVREALAAAGAGRIGAYEACAFSSEGTGYYKPGDHAKPWAGTPGGPLESAAEHRLEVQVETWHLPGVLQALREAHPYEEVAYDVYPVRQPSTRFGLGAVGDLEAPLPLTAFLEHAADRLQAQSLRYVGQPDREVRRIAVCGGAGSDLIGTALRAGADAYLTADLTYHRFFEPLDANGAPRMALIDAGHYETEAVTEVLLHEVLTDRFPTVRWLRTQRPTSPIQTFVGPHTLAE